MPKLAVTIAAVTKAMGLPGIDVALVAQDIGPDDCEAVGGFMREARAAKIRGDPGTWSGETHARVCLATSADSAQTRRFTFLDRKRDENLQVELNNLVEHHDGPERCWHLVCLDQLEPSAAKVRCPSRFGGDPLGDVVDRQSGRFTPLP
ncbi:hypothetical protein U1737_04845 [Sphingomonas sp. LB3N6]|uniref:hypothetical protein n=1 Tax=Sphingomonas fucosidasi TaxID=3096164 RepID=UPI002FCC944E